MQGVRIWLLVGLLLAAVPLPAAAQDNLNRGKDAQQTFNTDCAICHRSVSGLGASIGSLSLSSFLAGHYTTSKAGADTLARYLTAVGGSNRAAPPQRRPPRAAKPAKPAPPAKPKEN